MASFQPHKLSYWKLHFGTDVLMSCWFLLISTVCFTVIPIQELLSIDSSTDEVTKVYYISWLICGVAYLIGTIAFLAISYPDAMEDMMQSMAKIEIEKLSFGQRYFYGNSLLVMTWFFALATLPMVIYYFYAMVTGDISIAYGILAMIASFIGFTVLFVWVVATFPENMIKNNGIGSQYVVEFMVYHNLCCGNEEFWRYHFINDFLFGSWAFLVISSLSFPGAIYLFASDPTNFEDYMLFISSFFFVLGSILLVHASYPGNFSSDISWRMLTCSYSGEDAWFTMQIPRTDEEIQPLTEKNKLVESIATSPLHLSPARFVFGVM